MGPDKYILTKTIISQDALNQFNALGDAVSYWCEKRKNWITHKAYRDYWPFYSGFAQPYLSKEHYQKENPKWDKEYAKSLQM